MKTIILCADDYGQNQAISQAIIALLKKKHLSATSCMTTSVFWPVHAAWLGDFTDQADIGLHFNLTEGKPLSQALIQSHGFMSLSKLLIRAYGRALDAVAIEAELHAQLDHFERAMGCLPAFIDGHQHVHQLPVIRQVFLKVYRARLRQHPIYVRCVYEQQAFLHVKNRYDCKNIIIQLLGAKACKKELVKQQIPHNSSFSGIYSFVDAIHYAHIFPLFLAKIKTEGMIMCHPGLANQTDPDVIAKARFYEYQYLESEQFVRDCHAASVVLGRFKNIC
ncbi:MAG: hypothetical protein ACD_45C00218G0001 [uncultured bacterium]|nr:MAG: hypothetical protein ACD_45C00218G0001 [uncultured bacterium]